MKRNTFFITIAIGVSGITSGVTLSYLHQKKISDNYDHGGLNVCYSTPLIFNPPHENYTILHRKNSILANNGESLILNDFSKPEFKTKNCSVIAENIVFSTNDGDYILHNKIINKLKKSV